MNVWGFDLATRVGVALGEPPGEDLSKLKSYTVNLRNNREEDVYDLSFNFRQFLIDLTRFGDYPDLIAAEAPIPINADMRDGRPRNAESLLLPPLLVSRLRDLCKAKRIRFELLWPASIRSGFIDKKNAGERAKTKASVLDRCKQWGYLPEACKDDNRGDAVAVWHYAQIKFGRWQPPGEILFGKRVTLATQIGGGL
ncbi:MAG TPA: hypothetical protein VM434_18560 [Beijerinckiaceae bacterium]|nr:hypothetical protein [Beijerinckiaceae bacterium]